MADDEPKRFNLMLSADLRLKLDAYRRARGLRSEAEAMRALIEGAARVESLSAGFSVGVGDHLSVYADADAKPAKAVIVPAVVQFGPVASPVGSRLKKPKGTGRDVMR